MKVSEIMSRPALAVTPADGPRLLERLVALGRLRHLPIIDDGRLRGMWLSDADGRLRMVGPEEVVQTVADAPAEDAVAELLGGKQAVLVWENSDAVGVVTQADILNIVRAAMAQGIGRRHPRPVVVRLTGPAGGGKSALLVRTIPLVRYCSVAVVRADDDPKRPATQHMLEGARVITTPRARFRAGLADALAELEDVQLVLFEDRSAPAEAARSIGEDHQVLVLTAADTAGLSLEVLEQVLSEAAALVVTKLDSAPPGFSLDELRERLAEGRPGVRVLGVAAALDDRGMLEWRDWLLSRVLPAKG